MKKRLMSFALLLLLCMGLVAPAYASSKDFVIENGVLTEYNGSGGKVTIPKGVTEIGSSVFMDNDRLTGVTIPKGVTRIGSFAFMFSGLTSVTIPDGVTRIDDFAFSYCEDLTTVTIPKSVTTLGNYVFSKSTSLTDIYFGGSKEQWSALKVTDIGDDVKIHYNHKAGGFPVLPVVLVILVAAVVVLQKKNPALVQSVLRQVSSKVSAVAASRPQPAPQQGYPQASAAGTFQPQSTPQQGYPNAPAAGTPQPPSVPQQTYPNAPAAGTPQPQSDIPGFCPWCGKPVSPDIRFCPYCGKSLQG